jgi:hypothetical protein
MTEYKQFKSVNKNQTLDESTIELSRFLKSVCVAWVVDSMCTYSESEVKSNCLGALLAVVSDVIGNATNRHEFTKQIHDVLLVLEKETNPGRQDTIQ